MEPIRSSFEDDPDMMEIVREFADEAPERADQLQASLQAEDLPALQTLAHQLKGAGGGYGFDSISLVAAALEQALKDSAETGVIVDRCAELCDTLRAICVSEAD